MSSIDFDKASNYPKINIYYQFIINKQNIKIEQAKFLIKVSFTIKL